jgi:protein-disulfide isomerase
VTARRLYGWIAAAVITAGAATVRADDAERRLNERGPADAPVIVVEYCSYQSLACARLDAIMFSVLHDDGAPVRVVYRDVMTDDSAAATRRFRAALAAGAQHRFWDMHAMLMANQERGSAAEIAAMAQQLGLDAAQFERDLGSDAVADAVAAARDAAMADGVTTVPRLLINGRAVQVATARELRAALDAAGAR